MREISSNNKQRSLRLLAFVSSVTLCFVSAYGDDSTTPKTEANRSRSGGNGSKIAVICLVIVAVGVSSFFLYKFWQKKRREEQYARLLKLFEEDDELELELGLRD